jgi:hypothetical protein
MVPGNGSVSSLQNRRDEVHSGFMAIEKTVIRTHRHGEQWSTCPSRTCIQLRPIKLSIATDCARLWDPQISQKARLVIEARNQTKT